MNHKHLILGGARSGKSKYAEQCATDLALNNDQQVFYIATATADDEEMHTRIHHHQQRRSSNWSLIEEPTQLADAISQTPVEATVLVDCFTLWLSNCLHQDCWAQQRDALLRLVRQEQQRNLVLVSNEVGTGIVPMGKLSRQFVDESGWLHQTVATHCHKVSLVCAGLPLALKT